ncbi:MAG: glycosyltransferase family 39 protein [Elusimicrobia bacterium]|nr:glycosyltransferase family 39 protein [Elusimicrobiota bacterium]
MKKILQNLHFKEAFFYYFAIVALCTAIYSKTTAFGWTFFDDSDLILYHINFYSDPANLLRIFSFNIIPYESFYYRPLLTLSFFIDFIVGGGANPFVFHITNVILHATAACVLFAVLNKFVSRNAALLFTLLFVSHPVLVQAVAWIPGRNDSLLGLFIFNSFLFFLKWLENAKIKNFVFFNLFFLFAMFTKETAIILPFMLAAYIVIFDKPKKLLYILPPLILTCALFISLRMHFIEGMLPTNTIGNIVRSSPYVFHYFGKAFLPIYLSPVQMLEDYPVLPTVAAAVGFIVCCVIFKIKNLKLFAYGLLWFVTFTVPTLSLIRNVMLEHRIYVPLLGIILAIAQFTPKTPFNKHAKIFIYTAILLWFCVTSFVYSNVFINPIRFWTHAAQTSPNNSAVQIRLAMVHYHLMEDIERAKLHARKAISISPHHQSIEFLNRLIEQTRQEEEI